MKLFLSKRHAKEGDVIVSQAIKKTDVGDNLVLRRRRKVVAKRMGRTIEIKFSGMLAGERVLGLITFNQDELFQLAKALQRDRTDEEFFKAIRVAGQR